MALGRRVGWGVWAVSSHPLGNRQPLFLPKQNMFIIILLSQPMDNFSSPILSPSECPLGLQIRTSSWKVTQTNMIYIVGLPPHIADQALICSEPFCGQYGQITKIAVKEASGYRTKCYSAYVTFDTQESASLAVMALRGFFLEGYKISASYGTTKYCSSFLRYGKCRKNDCMFYHRIEPQKEIHEDDNKKVFNLQQELAKQYVYSNLLNIDFSSPLEHYIFPSKSSVRQQLIEEGIMKLPETPYSKRISEAETEYSFSSNIEKQDCDDELIVKKIRRATLRKKSLFTFVLEETTQEYGTVNKHLEDFLNNCCPQI